MQRTSTSGIYPWGMRIAEHIINVTQNIAEKIKETSTCKDRSCSWNRRLNTVKIPVLPKQSTDSMLSLSKSQSQFLQK